MTPAYEPEAVGHCLWTFTIPKMLRVFFRHHRELLGGLCRAGWEVVRELMAAALGDPSFRPGMVAVVQTHGDRLNWHPHVHAIATRGGWDAEGSFVPMPFVSTITAERRRLRRSWAQMIRRIYEVDPLTCTECGGEMRILAFLLDPAVVRKILDHLVKRPDRARAPPAAAFVATTASR